MQQQSNNRFAAVVENDNRAEDVTKEEEPWIFRDEWNNFHCESGDNQIWGIVCEVWLLQGEAGSWTMRFQ